MKLLSTLENDCGLRVYYSARDLKGVKDFHLADVTSEGFLRPKADFAAISRSKYFVLIYPEPVVSSVLFEAGIALYSCVRCIYFVCNPNDLPFLMRLAPYRFKNVEVCTYKAFDDILAMLKSHHHRLFAQKQ